MYQTGYSHYQLTYIITLIDKSTIRMQVDLVNHFFQIFLFRLTDSTPSFMEYKLDKIPFRRIMAEYSSLRIMFLRLNVFFCFTFTRKTSITGLHGGFI